MVMQGASSQWQQHLGAQRKPSRPSGATPPDVKLVAHAGTGTALNRNLVATLVVTLSGRIVMRSVGVREFRDRATQLMAAGETLVIERRGEPVGFFVPIEATDRRAGGEALERLGELIDDVLAETGLTEEELVSELAEPRVGPDAPRR